jgi:hypothetical protein
MVRVDMDKRPRTSVILVREWEQQLTGSGCCGKLEGDFLGCGDTTVFAERRAVMERMGPVYRTIRERCGDAVEVQVVDPRNIALIPFLVRDFWTFRVGIRSALATLVGLPKQGVIVNGRLVDRTAHPDSERICGIVDEAARGGRVHARRPKSTLGA